MDVVMFIVCLFRRDPVQMLMSQEMDVLHRMNSPVVSTYLNTDTIAFQRSAHSPPHPHTPPPNPTHAHTSTSIFDSSLISMKSVTKEVFTVEIHLFLLLFSCGNVGVADRRAVSGASDQKGQRRSMATSPRQVLYSTRGGGASVRGYLMRGALVRGYLVRGHQ